MRVVYYSNNKGNPVLLAQCLRLIEKAVATVNAELVCVTWQPLDTTGINLIYQPAGQSGHINIYRQILRGLDGARDDEGVCLAEHDVMYPAGYIHEISARMQPAALTYNRHIFYLSPFGFCRPSPEHYFLSNCAGLAGLMRECAEGKIRECERHLARKPKWAEFGVDQSVPKHSMTTTVATVDVRHDRNLTGMRFGDVYQEHLQGWGCAADYAHFWQGSGKSMRLKAGDLAAKTVRLLRRTLKRSSSRLQD